MYMKTNKLILTAAIVSCISSTAMAADSTTHDYHTGQYPVAESVKNSVIYGHDTNVTQAQGHLSGIIAGGENNTVQLDAHNSATFGISNNNNSENSVVAGSHNTITNANNSIAGGIYNASHSSNTAIFGYNNAIDFNSDNSFAGGKKVKVQGQNSFAFGEEAHAFGNNAIAIGKNVEALGDDSINIGANNTVQDSLSNGVIIGTNNTVNKYYSGELTGKNIVAIGNGNLFENSSESIAIGGSIIQGADRSVGIGANSKVAAPNSVALGYDTFAYDVESTESAEINGKTYTFAGGIAHGTVGIGARGDNGERTITGLAAGRINEESTDAINGSQLHAVITEVENNRTKVNNTMEEAKSYTDSEVAKVGAASAALSALHPLEFNKDDKWQFAVGFGNYKNKTATAIGAFYQPNENILLSLGATLSTNNMINGGATFRFGKHSNMNIDKQVATDTKVQNLEQRLTEMKAKYNELLAKVESK